MANLTKGCRVWIIMICNLSGRFLNTYLIAEIYFHFDRWLYGFFKNFSMSNCVLFSLCFFSYLWYDGGTYWRALLAFIH